MAIGLNSPRISTGASGFRSIMSICGGPPSRWMLMTALVGGRDPGGRFGAQQVGQRQPAEARAPAVRNWRRLTGPRRRPVGRKKESMGGPPFEPGFGGYGPRRSVFEGDNSGSVPAPAGKLNYLPLCEGGASATSPGSRGRCPRRTSPTGSIEPHIICARTSAASPQPAKEYCPMQIGIWHLAFGDFFALAGDRRGRANYLGPPVAPAPGSPLVWAARPSCIRPADGLD